MPESAFDTLPPGDCDAAASLVQGLAEQGTRVAVTQLAPARECLDKSKPERQVTLTRHLLHIVQPGDIEALAHDLLHHKSSFVQDAAAAAVVELGAPGLPALERLTEDEDRDVRWYAFQAIAEAVDPRYIDLLIAGLQDDDFSIRWTASNGLIAIGPGTVIPLLRALVDDDASPLFHNAARRIFTRVDAAGDLGAEVQALADAMGRGTTVYETSYKARDILRRLGGEAPAP